MKKFKFKSIFSVLFNSYIIMLCIPILLSVGLVFLVDKLYMDKYIKEMEECSSQSILILDKKIELIDTKVRSLIFDFKLNGILQLPEEEFSAQNIYKIRTFQKHLNDLFLDVSYEYDIILKNDYVFTNGNVVFRKDFFYNNYREYENLEYEKWEEKSFLKNEKSFLPSSKTKSHGNNNIITYIVPIFNGYNNSDIVASTQILIKEYELLELLNPAIGISEYSVLLIADNEIIYKYSNTEEIEANIEDRVLDYVKKDNNVSGHKLLKQGTDIELVYKKSNTGNYTIVIYTPKALIQKELNKIRILIFLFLSLSIIIEIVLGIYFSKMYSKPLRNIIENIQNMLSASESKDDLEDLYFYDSNEYDKLNSAVNQLLLDSNVMKTKLKESQIKENKNFFRNILLGNIHVEDILSKFEEIDIDLSEAKSFYVVSILYNDCNNLMEKIKLNLIELNILFPIIMEDKYLVLIIYTDDKFTNIDSDFKRILEIIYEVDEIKENIKCGVGRAYQNINDISFSYNQSIHCIQTLKEQDYISIYDYSFKNMDSIYYPLELEERLVNITRQGDIEQISEIFNAIKIENIENRNLSKMTYRLLYFNIASTILKIYQDIITNEQTFQMLKYIQDGKLDPVAMLGLEEEWIKRIATEVKERKSDKQEELSIQFEEYIINNYFDSQMSVKIASKNFDFSESYFSILFKDIMNDSFGSYLEKYRINISKALIEDNVSVEKISEMVGYNNSGTFRRAFKRITGVSPSVWKESK